MTPTSLAILAYLTIGAFIALLYLWTLSSRRRAGNPHEPSERLLAESGALLPVLIATLLWPGLFFMRDDR